MKTLKEATNEAVSNCGLVPNYEENNYDAGYCNGLISGFKACAEFLQRWISVKESLPPIDESCEFNKKYGFSKEVLVQGRNTYYIGYYCHHAGCWNVKGTAVFYEVEYWRPIEFK